MTLVTLASTSALAGTVGHDSEPGASTTAGASPTHPFVGDDPVAVRDALAKENLSGDTPTLRERIRKLIHLPGHQASSMGDSTQTDLNRDLEFVIPVSNGILYRSKTHVLTVDADLSGNDVPQVIQLKKTVVGPSGRGLTVPSEAIARGYVQHVELIELQQDELGKTRVHGRVMLSHSTFSSVDGDFAVVVLCSIEPPYLSVRHDHSAPSDDNPTDITTTTSTLYANVHAVWLVNPRTGDVLTTKLRLSK
jgi:hypothetical protein